EDGIRDFHVTGVQTCALPIYNLLDKEYIIIINNLSIDATNAKIVQDNEGILFTLPIHDELKKNTLIIFDKAKQTCKVLNQYGAEIGRASCRERVSISVDCGSW